MLSEGSLDLVDLSQRLRWLMEHIPSPRGKRWTQEALARACAARDVEVSTSAIAHLVTGRRKAPSVKLLATIADVFGVPIEYFLDDSVALAVQKETDRLLELHAQWRQTLADEALRSSPSEAQK